MDWCNSGVEELLTELCDESQVRAKLHSKHHHWYSNRNKRYHLPVVVISVLAGSGNFVAGQFEAIEKYLILFIGVLSIFTSIISAVSQFLKLAQLSESHRIASLAWGKFYSKVKFCLLLRSDDRDDPREFLQSVVGEYDRLFEISPTLLVHFVDKLSKKLKAAVGTRFQLPYYMNGYKHIRPYREFEDNTDDEKIESQV